jgi:hypothetical protein
MSKESLEQVIDRAASDATFAARLRSEPDAALAGFDLTEQEKQALRSGDPAQLQAAGVDERKSKLSLL